MSMAPPSARLDCLSNLELVLSLVMPHTRRSLIIRFPYSQVLALLCGSVTYRSMVSLFLVLNVSFQYQSDEMSVGKFPDRCSRALISF